MDKVDWSKAPEGATHAAVANGRGRVCWYQTVPGSRSSYKFMYSYGPDSDKWSVGFSGQPEHGPLEPRPQPDNKEGEGVEWEPGVGAPPVGLECEVSIEGGIFTTCKVISYYDDMVWIDLGSRHPVRMIQECQFRPIQSHRDKVIEAACKHGGFSCSLEEFSEKLYDSGMLKLPGE